MASVMDVLVAMRLLRANTVLISLFNDSLYKILDFSYLHFSPQSTDSCLLHEQPATVSQKAHMIKSSMNEINNIISLAGSYASAVGCAVAGVAPSCGRGAHSLTLNGHRKKKTKTKRTQRGWRVKCSSE